MAASNTKFKVDNGLEVVGTANVSGNFRVEGDFAVGGNLAFSGTSSADYKPTTDDTYALGNTSTRWIVYSSKGFFGNVTSTGIAQLTNATADVIIPTSNAAAQFGSATRLWQVTANTVTAVTTAVSNTESIVGTSATFNALSGVSSAIDFITTIAAHGFSNGELVQYLVAAGNTALSGLTNASFYYVISANTTGFQLSTTFGGSNVNITAGSTSETGHTLVPVRIVLSSNGSLFAPAGVANVGTLRVLNNAVVNGTLTIANASSFSGNVAVAVDALFVDTVNKVVGIKNNSPSSADAVTITGNAFFTAANTGLRLRSAANTSQNASIAFMTSNTSNSRLTFTTYDNSNSSVKDGGFAFNLQQNATSTTTGLTIDMTNVQYKGSNVVHAGNFGIYNVSGTRVGP
jgi:hypothetical protein